MSTIIKNLQFKLQLLCQNRQSTVGIPCWESHPGRRSKTVMKKMLMTKNNDQFNTSREMKLTKPQLLSQNRQSIVRSVVVTGVTSLSHVQKGLDCLRMRSTIRRDKVRTRRSRKRCRFIACAYFRHFVWPWNVAQNQKTTLQEPKTDKNTKNEYCTACQSLSRYNCANRRFPTHTHKKNSANASRECNKSKSWSYFGENKSS